MTWSASGIIAVAIFLILVSGCSVKEKRDDCPCRLFLDLSSVDKLDQTPVLLSVLSDGGFEYTTEVDAKEFYDTIVVNVPRTDLHVMVWSGGDDYMNDYGLIIPLGSGCPPV